MPEEEEMSQAVQEIEKLRDLIVDCARRSRRDGPLSLRGLKTDDPLLSAVVENICSSSNSPNESFGWARDHCIMKGFLLIIGGKEPDEVRTAITPYVEYVEKASRAE
jgi:hypothetical protein